jgi:hypothetical protein
MGFQLASGVIMEKAYWLKRNRASLKMAKNAASAQAKLAHYDLAGRYSLKALSAEVGDRNLADLIPVRIGSNDQRPSHSAAVSRALKQH